MEVNCTGPSLSVRVPWSKEGNLMRLRENHKNASMVIADKHLVYRHFGDLAFDQKTFLD